MMQHRIASQLGWQRGNYRGRKRLDLRSIHKYPGKKPPKWQVIGNFHEPTPILPDIWKLPVAAGTGNCANFQTTVSSRQRPLRMEATKSHGSNTDFCLGGNAYHGGGEERPGHATMLRTHALCVSSVFHPWLNYRFQLPSAGRPDKKFAGWVAVKVSLTVASPTGKGIFRF